MFTAHHLAQDRHGLDPATLGDRGPQAHGTTALNRDLLITAQDPGVPITALGPVVPIATVDPHLGKGQVDPGLTGLVSVLPLLPNP